MNKSRARGAMALSEACKGEGMQWAYDFSIETQICEIMSLDAIYPGFLKIINKGLLRDNDIGQLEIENEGLDFRGVWCTSSYDCQVNAGQRGVTADLAKLVQYKLLLSHEIDVNKVEHCEKKILVNVTYPLTYPPDSPDVTLAFDSTVLIIGSKKTSEDELAHICQKILMDSQPLFQERIIALSSYLLKLLDENQHNDPAVWDLINAASKRKLSVTNASLSTASGSTVATYLPKLNIVIDTDSATADQFKDVDIINDVEQDEDARSRFHADVLKELGGHNANRKSSSMESKKTSNSLPSDTMGGDLRSPTDSGSYESTEEYHNTSGFDASSSCYTGDDIEVDEREVDGLIKPNPLDVYAFYNAKMKKKRRRRTTQDRIQIEEKSQSRLLLPKPPFPDRPSQDPKDYNGLRNRASAEESNGLDGPKVLGLGGTRSLIPRTISLPRLSGAFTPNRSPNQASRLLNDFNSFGSFDPYDGLIMGLIATNKIDRQTYWIRIVRLQHILERFSMLARCTKTTLQTISSSGGMNMSAATLLEDSIQAVMSHFVSAVQSFSHMEHPHIGRIYSTWLETINVNNLQQLASSPAKVTALAEGVSELCCVVQLDNLEIPKLLSPQGRKYYSRDSNLPVRVFQQSLETICFLHRHSMAFLTDFSDVRVTTDDLGLNVCLRYPSFHVLLVLAIQSAITVATAGGGSIGDFKSPPAAATTTQRHSSSSPHILSTSPTAATNLIKSSHTVGGYKNLNQGTPFKLLTELLAIPPVIARCLELHSATCFSPVKSTAGACSILKKSDLVIFCHYMLQVLDYFEQGHTDLANQCRNIVAIKNIEHVPDPVDFLQSTDVTIHRDELKTLLYLLSNPLSHESHLVTRRLLSRKVESRRTVPYLFQSREGLLVLGWVDDLGDKLTMMEWQLENFSSDHIIKGLINLNFQMYSDSYQFSSLVYKEILCSQLSLTATNVLRCQLLTLPSVVGMRAAWHCPIPVASDRGLLLRLQMDTLMGIWESMSCMVINQQNQLQVLPNSGLQILWPKITEQPATQVVGSSNYSDAGYVAITNVYSRPKIYGHPDMSSRYLWVNDYDTKQVAFLELLTHTHRQLMIFAHYAPPWTYELSFPAILYTLAELLLGEQVASFNQLMCHPKVVRVLQPIMMPTLTLEKAMQGLNAVENSLFQRHSSLLPVIKQLRDVVSAFAESFSNICALEQLRFNLCGPIPDSSIFDPAALDLLLSILVDNRSNIAPLIGLGACWRPSKAPQRFNAYLEMNLELFGRIINFEEFHSQGSLLLAQVKSPQILIVFQRWSVCHICQELNLRLQQLGFTSELRLKPIVNYNALKREILSRNPGLSFIIRVQSNKLDITDGLNLFAQFKTIRDLIVYILKYSAKAKSSIKSLALKHKT